MRLIGVLQVRPVKAGDEDLGGEIQAKCLGRACADTHLALLIEDEESLTVESCVRAGPKLP